MMHSPSFRCPLVSDNIFWIRGKFPKFYLLPKIFSIFIRQNFWWPFFWRQPQVSNLPPSFAISMDSPYFAKIILSPYFSKFPLFSLNLRVFTYSLCFSFPLYFDHDAFMHHTLHVLDALGQTWSRARKFKQVDWGAPNCHCQTQTEIQNSMRREIGSQWKKSPMQYMA